MAAIHVGVACWPRPQPSEVRDVIHSMFVVNSQFSRLCKLFQAGFDRAKLRERERERKRVGSSSTTSTTK